MAEERQIGRLLNLFDKLDPQTSFALAQPTSDQLFKLINAKLDLVMSGSYDQV